MELKGFQTVDSKPGLYHPGLDSLIISDVHLGLESSMTSRGSYVPRFQLEEIKEDIREMKDETCAERILVNGDLKNEFTTSYSEKKEISDLLEFLKEEFEDVILVKGNHDTMIEETVEEQGLRLLDSYREDGVLFAHGHEEIEEEFETAVIGHEHPALALEDEIGTREKVNCFLYGETEKGKSIVVLPAFSKISNGTNVNEVPSRELLSPVLRNRIDKSTLKAVAVDREAGIFKFPELGQI